jgi:hypothetical protein
MVRRMPGESPGRDWDVLLTPPPETPLEHANAEREHQRRRKRNFLWKLFGYTIFGLTILAWLSLGPLMLRPGPWQWLSGAVWFIVLLPAMCAIVVVILRGLERRVIPSADRELADE